MSFIPENTAGINVITPKPGSGLTVQTSGNVDTLSTDNILQGTGIVLTRNTVLNTLTINSSALGSGVVSVTPLNAQGSGVNIVSSAGPAVSVTVEGAYVGGTGILLTPNTTPGNQTISIANTMDVTSVNGSGITCTQTGGAGNDVQLATNLVAGTNISITSSGVSTAKTFDNTMAVSGTGAGIVVTQAGPGQNVTVQNTGVTSAVAGTGISVSGATGAVTIGNTGVTAITAGTGLSASGSTGGVTLANTMAVSQGTGITVTQAGAGQNATIAANITGTNGCSVTPSGGSLLVQNTGVRSLLAGSGIALSGSTGVVTVSTTAGQPSTYYNLGQPDPSTYGYGYITNGSQIGFGITPSLAFNTLLTQAGGPSVPGSILVQFTLQLSGSPATPPGGPIAVQFTMAGTQLAGVSVNSPTIYPSPYQTGGTYQINAVIPFSSFFGTTGPFDIRVVNNYGAVIYAVLMSPVIATFVPDGFDT